MSCIEKSCVFPVAKDGYCAIHARMFEEAKALERPYYDTGHTEHVLIRGAVYRYTEKAPFVRSGVSVCGAIEYDAATDFLRCHECGEFFENLGVHIGHHEMGQDEYREKHGLNARTPLANYRLRQIRSVACTARRQYEKARQHLFKKGNGSTGGRTGQKKMMLELLNARGNCKAQIVEKLKEAAAELGRRPKERELVEFDTNWTTVRKYFGSMDKAMKASGIPEDIPDCKCVKCGHEWFSEKGIPEKCPNTPCQTKFWRAQAEVSTTQTERAVCLD